MKRTLFLLVLATQVGFGQTLDTLQNFMLSPEELQEDFNMYRRMLEETHPGLYRYAKKETIQRTLDSISSTLTDSKPFYEFYTQLALFNAKIKCAHSYVMPLHRIDNYLIKNFKTVPFYFHGIDESLYVIFNGSLNEEIKPGYEILSINGRSVSEIRKTIDRYAWVDTDIENAKVKYMAGAYFWMMYYLFVDQSEELNITYEDLEGAKGEVSLKAQTPRQTMSNYKKNPVNKDLLKLLKDNKSANPFRLEMAKDVDKTAILTLSGFGGKGINDEDDAQTMTRKFMDKAMKKMKKAGTESLIIDLRYNGGGWDIIAIELLTYLAKSDDPIKYYEKSFVIMNIDDTEFLKFTEYQPSDSAQLKEELIPQGDGTFLLNPRYNVNMRENQPKAERFEGDVYILIHEMTGSAASEFAGLAKSMGVGTLVGTETFGAYQGGNGSTFIKMSLPNSGIFVNSPLVSGYQELKPQAIPNRGVLPHHEVDITRDDILIRYDRQMEFAKDLIRNSSE